MPDMQTPAPATTAVPPVLEAAVRAPFDDADYPLGCECADPALQIERWLQEASGAGTGPA